VVGVLVLMFGGDVWWCWKARGMRIGVLTSSLEP
jgi:hypothetical protein